jgi:ABC-type multidrug transport system fused ATPase/permease subunit
MSKGGIMNFWTNNLFTYRELNFFYRFIGLKSLAYVVLSFFVGVLDALTIALLLPILTGSLELAPSFFLQLVTENRSIVVLVFLLLILVKSILSYFVSFLSVKYQHSFVADWRLWLSEYLPTLNLNEYRANNREFYHTRFSSEIVRIGDALFRLLQSLSYAAMMMVYIGFALYFSLKVTLLILIITPVLVKVYGIIKRRLIVLSKALNETNLALEREISYYLDNREYFIGNKRLDLYKNWIRNSINLYSTTYFKFGKFNAISLAIREPLVLVLVSAAIFIHSLFEHEFELIKIVPALLVLYRASGFFGLYQVASNQYKALNSSVKSAIVFFYDGVLQDTVSDFSIKPLNSTLYYGWSHIEINLSNQSFIYPSLEIRKGEKLLVKGESGSGKTTLLRFLVEYTLEWKSNYPNVLPSKIGYMPQRIAFHGATVKDNLSRLFAPYDEVSLNKYLQKFSCSHLIDEAADNLSGGELQRVYIAGLLSTDMDLFIMDEPFSALDKSNIVLISKILLTHGSTIILSAHNLGELELGYSKYELKSFD